VTTKNSAVLHKTSLKTTPKPRLRRKAKLKKKGPSPFAFLTTTAATVAVASRLLVIAAGGLAPTAPNPRPRPCSIVGVHGYASTSTVRCDLYGANSNTPTSINATVTNFRWQVNISMTAVPAGDYMAEIIAFDSLGTLQESMTFALTLS
jgi:hypothetical protein